MMARDGTDAAERRLYLLIALAVILSVGHHVDHVIRGNNVGWPIDSEVNAFTFSLLIYPLILIGLLHFAPAAIEPPREIVDPYDSPVLGWLALAWLVAFIGVLAFTSLYEARLQRRRRRDRGGSRRAGRAGGAVR
jgi:hypothetical protein